MSDSRSAEYQQKVAELIAVINMHKWILIVKHGSQIAEEWSK